MAPINDIPIETWQGCYEERWAGLIVDAAMSHPAKMSRALVRRIFDELFTLGAIQKGDTVLDPFGGVASTAIEGASRGVCVICVELEPKFVALARENIELHRRDWEAMDRPIPMVLQGDSRRLRAVLCEAASAIITSPPYVSGGHHPDQTGAWNQNGRGQQGQTRETAGYGTEAGQLGQMAEGDIDAVVSSPTYVDAKAHQSLGHPELGLRGDNILNRCTTGARAGDERYGTTDGQLGAMDKGTVDAVVSSPPYAEIAAGAGGLNTKPPKREGQQGGRSAASASQDTDQRYGESEGQLARLQLGTVDAVVSSPPYEESVNAKGHGIDWTKADPKATGNRRRGDDCKHGQTFRNQLSYGDTPGQLGQMDGEDGVDAVVSSPPYMQSNTKPTALGSGSSRADGDSAGRNSGDYIYGDSAGQLGRMDSGDVDAIVSSPPFLDARSDTTASVKGNTPTQHDPEAMGTCDGNLAAMCGGSVDAVVSSPPFAQPYSGGGGINTRGYGPDGADKVGTRTYQALGGAREDGNLETMPVGEVDAIVSSPPWGEQAEGAVRADKFRNPADFLKAGRGHGCSDEARLRQLERDRDKTYGDSDRQLAGLPMGDAADALVTSPPYEGSLHASEDGIDWQAARRTSEGGGEHLRPSASVSAAYPENADNIGNATGETFWSAAKQIVEESFAILKSGGYVVWIVKAFVRHKAIVDFPGDWRRLCEHVGFETVKEARAMLVTETRRPDLFDGEVVTKKARKSFFRRLYEQKYPHNSIDYEVVLFMKKPCP